MHLTSITEQMFTTSADAVSVLLSVVAVSIIATLFLTSIYALVKSAIKNRDKDLLGK
jgi:Na+-translocating ferredoxin:NAD+ oxidoreductase RnfG subunit